MKPLRNAEDEVVNWLNYNTGVKHLYFRLDANNKQAAISIELRHSDVALQQYYFLKFRHYEKLFHQTTGEKWDWQLQTTDEDGQTVSRIIKVLKGVNIFNSDD